MKLVYAVFTTVTSGIVFSIVPADKGYILTVLAPRDQTKYVGRMMESYQGERVDDVNHYACFELRMLTQELSETIGAVREMFVSMRTSRPTYYYGSDSAPEVEPDFIAEPAGDAHHFIVKMLGLPRSSTSKFTVRARGRSGIVSCTVAPGDIAQANLHLEPERDEAVLVDRLAQLYGELAATA